MQRCPSMRRFAAAVFAAVLLAVAPGDAAEAAAAAAAAAANALPQSDDVDFTYGGEASSAAAPSSRRPPPPQQQQPQQPQQLLLRGRRPRPEAKVASSRRAAGAASRQGGLTAGVALVRQHSQQRHAATSKRRAARRDGAKSGRKSGRKGEGEASSKGAAEQPEVVCVDSPGDWRSKSSSTCADYASFHWCTEEGDYGDGWGDNGDFKDWTSKDGLSAVQACCTCGGGREVDVSVGNLGDEACPSGDAILDVTTCEAVSRALGANFASAAAWPKGHPRGCHTDERRSNVWMNTDPAASGGHYHAFARLCASERGNSEEEDDDDDDEDHGGDREANDGAESDDDDDAESEENDGEEAEKEKGGGREGEDEEEEEEGEEDDQEEEDDDRQKDTRQEEDDKMDSAIKVAKAKLREQVVTTHAELVKNMKRRVQIGLELRKLDDEGASRKEIASSMEAVKHETKSAAMANLLGDMWREMRMFATPFYEERLDEELVNLEHQEPALEDNYEKAKAALAASEKSSESPEPPEAEAEAEAPASA